MFLALLTTIVYGQVLAQSRTISGKVTSKDDGTGLPGVTVLVKGTTIGVQTDIEGMYKLSVDENAKILVFSFVGMKTIEREIGNASQIDLAMESDSKQLLEVVVTAVGIERNNKKLGYSIEQMSGEKVTQKAEPDVLRGMQGKIAGVQISGSGGAAGGATRITIRGNNTIAGNNQPLFVVDGVPFNNDYDEGGANSRDIGGAASNRAVDLDPNNIESMTVLKGGAAAALYGTRAANGVVVITTKTGAKRKNRKGTEVTYGLSVATEQIASMPEFSSKYGSGTAQVYAHANGNWGPQFGLGRIYNAAGGWIKSPSGVDSIPNWLGYEAYAQAFPSEAWNKYRLVPGGRVAYKDAPNNVSSFFQTGHMIENSLSVSGGSEKSVLTAVLSRMTNKGFIPGSEFERTNISVGGNTNLDNGLSVGGTMAYTNTAQESPLAGNNGGSFMQRTYQMPRNWPLHELPYVDPAGNQVFMFFGVTDNPFWAVKNSTQRSNVDRVAGNLNLSYNLSSWMNIAYKIGVNSYSDKRTRRIAAGSLTEAQGIGQFDEDNIFFQEIESNLLATFTNKIGDNITLRSIVGHNINQRTNESRQITSLGIVFPGLDNLGNVNTVTPNGSTYSRRRLWALFADVTASYKDFLDFNATLRNDNTSTLPEANRSYFYYSGSASLNVTEAVKSLKSDWLNSLRLRASYARIGRDANPYLINPVYVVNPKQFLAASTDVDFPFNSVAGMKASATLFDPNLKPEFTNEIEAGFAVDAWKNKISLDVTYYDRLTTGMIGSRNVPLSTGYQAFLTNLGEIRNSGWEISLGLTPVQLQNSFRWNINTVFTRNVSKVETLGNGVQEVAVRNLFTTFTSVLRPGEPYGVIRGTAAMRDDKGNLLIDPATGFIMQSANQKIIGDPNPVFTLGVTNNFSFKGFTLSAVIDYKHRGDIFSRTNEFLLGRGTVKDLDTRDIPRVIPGVLGDRVTEKPLLGGDGQPIVNNIQVNENNLWFNGGFAINAPSEMNVYDGTVVRLREVSLGYDVPKAWLEKSFMSKYIGAIHIDFTGRNLWFYAPNFPKYSNFDPEVSSLGASNAQGFDLFGMPSVRRYGFNLRVTF